MDVISLDNIDILSKWRVEVEVPLLDEAPAWLEEGDQEKQQQEEEEEELHPYTIEDDVPVKNETPSSTQFGVASPPSIIDLHIVNA